MPHNHTPPPPRDHDAAYRHRRALLWALALTASVMIIEFIVGINIGSLALLADAAHMATDTTALLLAALTAHATTRPSPAHRSFGLLRLEVLTATINALLLTGLCITIVAEAITRIGSPTTIPPHTLLVTATIGLLINLISWRILHPSAQQSINVNAARLEVLADLIGSVTVILTALLLAWTGWWWLDSLAAISLAVLIIPRTAHILRDTIRILLEAAPRTTSIPDLTAALATLPGCARSTTSTSGPSPPESPAPAHTCSPHLAHHMQHSSPSATTPVTSLRHRSRYDTDRGKPPRLPRDSSCPVPLPSENTVPHPNHDNDSPPPTTISDHTATHLADTFSLLGDPSRIRVLGTLLDGPKRVLDIAQACGHTQSATSHSLRLLKAHHVVAGERHGREIHYALADDHVRALLTLALAHIAHLDTHPNA